MGAQLIIATCNYPVNTRGDYIIKPYDGLREQIEERLRALKPELLNDYASTFLVLEPEEVFPAAVDAVLEFLEVWDNSREVTGLEVNADRPIIVTGGPSWGDNPTECFGVVSFINYTELFEEPFNAPLDEWFVTVDEKVWRTYSVKAESEEAALALALECDAERINFENLVSVKDGLVILEDEGTYPDPETSVYIKF